MADTQRVDALVKHLDEEHAKTRARLLANKPKAAEALEAELPPGDEGFAGGVGHVTGEVVGGVGGVIGGVASTGADAIGAVGTVANAAHNAVNDFFHGLRTRLGI